MVILQTISNQNYFPNDLKSSKSFSKQDHQALLKAKYCSRAAAASCTQETQKKPCDLDF